MLLETRSLRLWRRPCTILTFWSCACLGNGSERKWSFHDEIFQHPTRNVDMLTSRDAARCLFFPQLPSLPASVPSSSSFPFSNSDSRWYMWKGNTWERRFSTSFHRVDVCGGWSCVLSVSWDHIREGWGGGEGGGEAWVQRDLSKRSLRMGSIYQSMPPSVSASDRSTVRSIGRCLCMRISFHNKDLYSRDRNIRSFSCPPLPRSTPSPLHLFSILFSSSNKRDMNPFGGVVGRERGRTPLFRLFSRGELRARIELCSCRRFPLFISLFWFLHQVQLLKNMVITLRHKTQFQLLKVSFC